MCSKKCFSKLEATTTLNYNYRHGRQYRKEVRMYYCEYHNAWHLTSMEDEPAEPTNVKLIHKKRWKRLIMNN